ncbi:MAG: DUF1826 domain-containing protein [Nitrosomonas sp.]|nr:DUF1826 domain-containing protein [Nitrosomonas sp.]
MCLRKTRSDSDGWEGNEGLGVIHRSPSLNDNEARLLLTLDFVLILLLCNESIHTRVNFCYRRAIAIYNL